MSAQAAVGEQDLTRLVTDLVADRAEAWDRAGRLPADVIRSLAKAGALSPQIPGEFGGRNWSSGRAGEFTAHVGALCSSTRSMMTSQGMAAWTVQRLGGADQRSEILTRLASGSVAAVAFSEPAAGSDLAAIQTRIERSGDTVRINGAKTWITGAAYADLIVVFGRYGSGNGNGGAAVVVPATAHGVTVTTVPDPLGCRAAGHADVRFDDVEVPADQLLSAAGSPLEWLVTSALTYGRLSVAWGCVGILRACLRATTAHARTRNQFGVPLAEHQLVGRHLAELYVAEQAAAALCESASGAWDAGRSDLVSAAVAAKHFAATSAARGAASAVQVLASAGARDGHPVARAYRDAKLMEVIEGSNEISQLVLARQAVSQWS